jgi:hypothetical protein
MNLIESDSGNSNTEDEDDDDFYVNDDLEDD